MSAIIGKTGKNLDFVLLTFITTYCVYKDSKYCQMALISFGTQTTERYKGVLSSVSTGFNNSSLLFNIVF